MGRRGGFKEMVERRGEIEEGIEKGEIIRYMVEALYRMLQSFTTL